MYRHLPAFIYSLPMALCLYATSSLAVELPANSQVEAVTVYQNRALITRDATIDLPKGAHEIVISNLPAMLDPDTIRVSGQSSANVVIGTVKNDRINTPELTNAREKELNTQIQALNDQLALLDADQKAIAAQQQFLQNIGKQAQLRSDEEIATLNLNSDQWAGAAKALGTNLSETMKALVSLNVKKRELTETRDALQAEMDKLRGGRKNYYVVSIAVEAESATTLNLELSYQTPNATWYPVYDARLTMGKDGNTALELLQFGTVAQSTGEDWSNVELTLSTAQPHRATILPDLTPNWADIYPEGSRMPSFTQSSGISSRAMNYAAESADFMASAEMVAAPTMQKAAHRGASVESNGFSVEYKIAGRVNVPSDGSDSKLTIGAVSIDHVMETHIRPQLSQNAFWVAKMTLKGDAPMLAGDVSLYRDEAFIGKSYLPFIMPNKEHNLSFGMNDQITVAMKTLKEERKEAGMVLSSNTFTKHLVTEIENSGPRATPIILQKNIPAPRNEALEVEILSNHTTSGYTRDIDNLTGVLQWSETLAPSAKKEYKLGYELSWPKGYNLNGRF